MNTIMDFLAKLDYLSSLNGKSIRIDKPLGSTGRSLDVPMKDRLRASKDEALNRKEMEQAVRGQAFDSDKAQQIAIEYTREKILKDFAK